MPETVVAPPAAPAVAPPPPAGGTPPAAAPAAPVTPKAPPEASATVITDDAEPKAPEASKDQPKGETPPKGDFQIKVPEGFNVDPEMLTGFTEFAQKEGIGQEAAQKALDFYVRSEQSLADKFAASQKETFAKWANEAKSDKEIGGSKWVETVADAKRALNQFATPELKKILNETGLGNRKEVIAFFAKAGKALAEDKTPKGAAASGNEAEQKPLEEVLYTTMDHTKK